VNDQDLFSVFNGAVGGSSWYGFNFDGKTDPDDKKVVEEHLGTNCAAQARGRVTTQRKP
jgi:hypothetical protein